MWATRSSCEELPYQSGPFKLEMAGPDEVPADYKSTRRKFLTQKQETLADSVPVNVVSSFFEVETADVVDQAEMKRYEHIEYVGYMGTQYYPSSGKQSRLDMETSASTEIDDIDEESDSETIPDVISFSVQSFESQEDDEPVSWFIEVLL